MDPMDYIKMEQPSYLSDEFELAVEYQGMLEHSPITITAPWVAPDGSAGFARRKVTTGGTYVQKFNSDGSPATKVQAYRRKETECYQFWHNASAKWRRASRREPPGGFSPDTARVDRAAAARGRSQSSVAGFLAPASRVSHRWLPGT